MKTLRWTVAVLMLLGILGLAATRLTDPRVGGVESASAAGEEELGPLLPMDDIVVNVADTDGRRWFKTSLTLEMEGDDLPEQAAERLPVLQGAMIDLFSTKTLGDLVQPAARDSLRSEILETLNDQVTAGEFRDVYFTEFVVQ